MNQEIKDDSTPQVEMVSDEMVVAYCNAVHHYLGNLSQEQWAEDRKDNYTAVHHVARIGLQAALNARAGGDVWLPIESAPKDGTEVILFGDAKWPQGVVPAYGDVSDCVSTGYFSGGIWQFMGRIGKPTHWQPLPTPPAALTSQAVGVKS